MSKDQSASEGLLDGVEGTSSFLGEQPQSSLPGEAHEQNNNIGVIVD